MTTLKLSKQISHEGKSWDEIMIREMTLGDLIAADGTAGESGRTAVILASVSGIPVPAIRQILARDVVAIENAMAALAGGNDTAPMGAGG